MASKIHDELDTLLKACRNRILTQTALESGVIAGAFWLPATCLLVLVDRMAMGGTYGAVIMLAGILGWTAWVGIAAFRQSLRLSNLVTIAQKIDDSAGLKDRVSSAWEFIEEQAAGDAVAAQLRDASKRARTLSLDELFPLTAPRKAFLVPLFVAALMASFFIPIPGHDQVDAALDVQRSHQLDEMKALRESLEEHLENKEVEDVLERLREIEKQFEKGEASERDMMLELARLEQDLEKRMQQLGVQDMAAELNTLVPHMMASEASKAIAKAMKDEDMKQAAEEMEKLGEKATKEELSTDEKEQLANNMGVAGAKLGDKKSGSFSGDLSKASEALKSSDSKSFESSTKSMAAKLMQISSYKDMKNLKKQLSLCKSNLGLLKQCSSCNGAGCGTCNGTGMKPGGLKAGVAASNKPLSDRSRLEGSYRELLQVQGMQGAGPVESEVETTDGETSESAMAAKDLYTEYSAVAEQAMEQEDIPLSHRMHVKQYFQAIRPEE